MGIPYRKMLKDMSSSDLALYWGLDAAENDIPLSAEQKLRQKLPSHMFASKK